MYDIEADRTENVLYIDLEGRMERPTIEDAADAAVRKATRLDDGFDIINDLSGFAPPTPEAARPIKRAQAELKELGVDRVVRVANEDTSQVVVNAFERRSRDVGYTGETAETVSEAERMLEKREISGFSST